MSQPMKPRYAVKGDLLNRPAWLESHPDAYEKVYLAADVDPLLAFNVAEADKNAKDVIHLQYALAAKEALVARLNIDLAASVDHCDTLQALVDDLRSEIKALHDEAAGIDL